MSATPVVYIYATASKAGSSSVQQKIISQIQAARKQDIDMDGWFFTTDSGDFPEIRGIRWFKVPVVNSGYFRSVKQSAVIYQAILHTAMKQLQPESQVYMRFWAPGRSMFRLAVLLKGRLTFNHVTIEQEEYKLYSPSGGSFASRIFGLSEFRWWPWLANNTWGRLIRRKAGKGVVNSQEIADHQRAMALGKYRCVIIPDGVDTESFPLHHSPVPEDEIRMVFLKGAAFEASYNGLDRLMKGMVAGGSRRKMKLSIIGSGLDHERSLAEACGAQEFTEFKDRMSKEELDAELNRFHLGVGALAVHRKGLKSTSSIKNREYMARGIPFFFAHHDPDFHGHPETLKYCLVLPGDETPLNVAELEQFTERIYADPDHASDMHRLASEYMDYKTKIRQIVRFIQER